MMCSTSSGTAGRSSYPGYTSHWPEHPTFRSSIILVACLILAVCSVIAMIAGGRRNETDTMVSGAGFALLAAALTSIGLTNAGCGSSRISRRITTFRNDGSAAGIRIPHKLDIRVLTMLLGSAVATFPALVPQWESTHLSLFDEMFLRMGGESVAVGSAVVSLGLLSLVFVVHGSDTLDLHTHGIRFVQVRKVLWRTRTSEVDLTWDEIESLTASTRPGSGNRWSPPLPTIEITTETRDDYTIDLYRLVCEPNTTMTLLDRLWRNPDSRSELCRSDSVGLLRPPPLRDRREAARGRTKQRRIRA